MQPMPPAPYGHTNYAFPQARLFVAQRVCTEDDAELAVFVYGPDDGSLLDFQSATPVLVLHGNGGSHSTFCQVIERLVAADLFVIAFDSRAQGQSSRGTELLSYELFAHDAICVLDALGVSRVHVAGHSDGGIEALLLARDWPERVASIVAGGANLTPDGVIDEWDTAGSVVANHTWAAWVESDDVPPEIDRSLLASAESCQLSAELLQLMLDEPHIEAASLAKIGCPTCVIVGEHDCIDLEQTQAIADAISGARLIVVPGVGHSIPREASESLALQVVTNILLAR